MATINVNSISNKLSYIKDFLSSNSLYVLALCETWLVSSSQSSFLDLPGYFFFVVTCVGL